MTENSLKSIQRNKKKCSNKCSQQDLHDDIIVVEAARCVPHLLGARRHGNDWTRLSVCPWVAAAVGREGEPEVAVGSSDGPRPKISTTTRHIELDTNYKF
jgi:hypothetical protein